MGSFVIYYGFISALVG